MAHIEPMEIENGFDNKENTYHVNNALPRSSCEKGNEKIENSEVNTKLQCSITQGSFPMSKSFTANNADCKIISSIEDHKININSNLTRSLNSTLNNSDNIIKSPKLLPLQSISDQYTDMDKHIITTRCSFGEPIENKELDRLSLPSTSSSLGHTPEATTPTKEIQKQDSTSPIIRGLKSVLNMFKSNSPIPPLEVNNQVEQTVTSLFSQNAEPDSQISAVVASTPVRHNNIKSISPVKESIVFQDDLERELQWKEDSAVFFKEEKIPIHILFPSLTSSNVKAANSYSKQEKKDISVEYMDISLNDTGTALNNEEINKINVNNYDSDGEFVDCESTLNNSELATNNKTQPNLNPVIDMSVIEYDYDVILNSNEQNQSLIPEPNVTELCHAKTVSISHSVHIADAAIKINKIEVNKDIEVIHDAISAKLPIDNTDICSEQKHTSSNQTNFEIKNIETIRDENIEKSDINKITEDNVSENTMIENRAVNINVGTGNLNKILDINSQIDDKDYLETGKIEYLKKTIYIEPIIENTSLDITLDSAEIPNLNVPVNTQIHLDIENAIKSEVAENSNETEMHSENKDNLSIKQEETYNIESNYNSNLTTSALETGPPDSIQVKDNEENDNQLLTSEISNYTMSNYSKLTAKIVKTSNNQDEKSKIKNELLNQISILPDVIQISQDDKKCKDICLKEDDTSVSTNDSLENSTETDILQDFNIHILKDTVAINESLSKNINKINDYAIQNESQNDAIHQLHQVNNINGKILYPKATPAVNENIEISSLMDSNKKVIENDVDLLSHVVQNNVEKSIFKPDSNSENKTDLKNRAVEKNICLSSNVLLAKDKLDLNVNNEINKENVLCENQETSAQLLNYIGEDFYIPNENQTNIINADDKTELNSNPLQINITDDNLIEENNTSDFNYNEVNFIGSDSKIEKKEDLFINQTNELDNDDLEVENINKSVATAVVDTSGKTKSRLLETPPTSPKSPKIVSKGYNFNFDDIDDPFATKNKIRSSPPIKNISNENLTSIQIHSKTSNRKKMLPNRRKSQPAPKRHNDIYKKKMNSTFDETVLVFKESNNVELQTNKPNENENNAKQHKVEIESNTEELIFAEEPSLDVKDDESTDILNISQIGNKKNVFNLPEIDDSNFNPFATRITLCSTPPMINDSIRADDGEPSDSNKTVILNNKITDEMSDESNDANSIKLMNKTTQEVHTEDEDTIEGPFLDTLGEDLNKIDENDMRIKEEKHPYEDFDSEEAYPYMAFDDLPKQENNEAENEMFIDAEAFEFLLNQNQTNVVADSGKESLFLKFDPLFAKRISSDGIVAALGNIQKSQCTETKEKQCESYFYTENTNTIPSCSKSIISVDITDEPNGSNLSKPTMAVVPAVALSRKSTSPAKINRQSLTFTSPAMAVIDRLLSLSENTSLTEYRDTSPPQRYSQQNHTDITPTQLREILAEKEMHVQALRNERKELSNRLGALEGQVKTLEYESEDRLKKINDLNKQILEKNKQNKKMSTVVEEYERTIAFLLSGLQQDKERHAEERMLIIKDRDEQTAHLASMEISFNDLHSKYEKSKQIILSLKANEDCLRKSLQEFEGNYLKIQNNYEVLKQHATSKLSHANRELEKVNKAHEADVLKLKAMMKRKDLHISSLEETLAQKTKANEELTAICDELINKVG